MIVSRSEVAALVSSQERLGIHMRVGMENRLHAKKKEPAGQAGPRSAVLLAADGYPQST